MHPTQHPPKPRRLQTPYGSRTQYCVRPSIGIPTYPRTFSRVPLSTTVIRHRYVLPVCGSRIIPLPHSAPFAVISHSIRNPTIGWLCCSPSHFRHISCGFVGSGSRIFSTFPYSFPFSRYSVTIDFAFPVASSIVRQRPTGELPPCAQPACASTIPSAITTITTLPNRINPSLCRRPSTSTSLAVGE